MGLLTETGDEYYGGSNKGSYQYTSINDIVNNFIIAYVGEEKVINRISRTDVIFHAKRGLQELSYDTIRSNKSMEIELGPNLSMALPQDYVNYTKLTWVDNNGVERIIYPTTLTSSPEKAPLQDEEFEFLYDNEGEILSGSSETEERWKASDPRSITGTAKSAAINDGYLLDYQDSSDYYDTQARRYGLQPETTQTNGFFHINQREGTVSFSSDLSEKVIILKYVSDSLATDAEMVVPKFAEEALYKHISLAILSNKRGIQEYIITRHKKEKRAAFRNTKIRLYNLKLENPVTPNNEFTNPL